MLSKKSMRSITKKKVVAVSGGFDPIHIGHIRLFSAAKKLGGKLVVILNNDNWLRKKKGVIFMPENQRKEILEALRDVDEVILTNHSYDPDDMSVCRTLKKLRPHVFANGGDRTHKNIPEVAICNAIGCKMVFGIGEGGKVQSSSWLLTKYINHDKIKIHVLDSRSDVHRRGKSGHPSDEHRRK